MQRKPDETLKEFNKREREYYTQNKQHILQRLKNWRDKNRKPSTKGKLIEHHVKYKEIHGVDETVWMSCGEHVQLHHRLRMEGKCNIPSDKLSIISEAAHHRTKKCIDKQAAYNKKNLQRIDIYTTIEKFIGIHEEIRYYPKSGEVGYTVWFQTTRGKQLKYIDI